MSACLQHLNSSLTLRVLAPSQCHHDDDPRKHRLAAYFRRLLFKGLALRPGCSGQHHPNEHGRSQGDQARFAESRWQVLRCAPSCPLRPSAEPALTAVYVVGISVRVPVTNVSLVDLTVTLSSDVESVEELLAPFRRPSDDVVSQHVLEVSDLELVSSDYLGTRASAVVDAKTCSVLGKRVAKILAFYDNEAGYALRMFYRSLPLSQAPLLT